jgi:hypothetical protein
MGILSKVDFSASIADAGAVINHPIVPQAQGSDKHALLRLQ